MTTVLAAAAWSASRKHTERDDLLQDQQILAGLEPGAARDRMADSIDERVMVLADRAERRRLGVVLEIAGAFAWFGLAAFWMFISYASTWLLWTAAVAIGLALCLGVVGSKRQPVSDKHRLTPRRRPASAPDAPAQPTAEPLAPVRRVRRLQRSPRAAPPA